MEGRDYGLEAALHDGKRGGGRDRHLWRTGGLDVLRRRHRGIGEIVQRRALRVIELKRLLDLIYREPCDIAAVIAAQLRQLLRHCSTRVGSLYRRLSKRAAVTAAAGWRIGCEVVIAVGIEH